MTPVYTEIDLFGLVALNAKWQAKEGAGFDMFQFRVKRQNLNNNILCVRELKELFLRVSVVLSYSSFVILD